MVNLNGATKSTVSYVHIKIWLGEEAKEEIEFPDGEV